MGLYKYMSFSNLEHLLNGTIRFTQPKAFNDPFELLPEMYLSDDINGFSLDVTAPKRKDEPARLADDFESKNCNDIAAAFFKVVVIIRLVIKRLFFLDLDEPHQRVHSSLSCLTNALGVALLLPTTHLNDVLKSRYLYHCDALMA